MPEPWVISIFVELFWPKSWSYFGKNEWILLWQEISILVGTILEFLWYEPLKLVVKCKNINIFTINLHKFPEFLSYCSDHLPKICRQLELFPQNAWVILKTLSYFSLEILELFSKRRKKSLCGSRPGEGRTKDAKDGRRTGDQLAWVLRATWPKVEVMWQSKWLSKT